MKIAGFDLPSDSPLFLSLLAVYVTIGLTAVITGAVAMLSEKRCGRHTSLGTAYYWCLAALVATSAALAGMRWADDYHLFVLGAFAFVAALVGRTARRSRWKMPVDLHIVGMGASYILMLTAFYVDNGKNLPVWRNLPHVTYWLLPSVVGVPLIMRALFGYREPSALLRVVGHECRSERITPTAPRPL